MLLRQKILRNKYVIQKLSFSFCNAILFCFCSKKGRLLILIFQTQVNQYITDPSYSEQLYTYWIVSTQLKTERQYKYIYYDLDVQGTLSLDESQRHFLSIPQANFGYHLENITTVDFLKSFQVSLGRYKREWSWLDSYWELGLWNPRNLFDYFNPQELGMIGSAIIFKGKNWSLTNFIGGLFLPNEQADIGKNKAGSIESKSRWGTPPATNISILDKELDAYYWIQKPYLTGVIFSEKL